ncbi:hypothetical protein Tco_0823889 [Tanacetum coccineum]|uniref:Uncharacterized protein n=1 Tax=Tanacetum coccineum TaxID=301880 RepID=A0ABQ5AJ56_9ASTR
MLPICNTNEPVAFKSPKPSSISKRVPQGTKPGAQPGHKKQSSSKQTIVSSKEATKGGSSKAPTGSKTGHSKKRKESSSAMDSNPSQPLVFTLVDPEMHKEGQQATGGPTSLGVTSEARANPQLSSGISSRAEADPGNSAPSDCVPQQQGINEETKNTSYDHLFAGIDLDVLADQTKSVSEGLDTVLPQPLTGKGANSITRQVEEEEASGTIKLKDLAKLVSNVQPSFKHLDSPEDDHVIIIEESDEEENDEIHATENVETKDTLVPKSSSIKSSLIQELTNQSLKTELLNILSTNDFSNSLPTELKDIPSKLNELTGEVQRLKNQVHNLEIELPGELKEIPTKLENFTKTVATVQAKLKTLDALPGLLSHVTKAKLESVPSAGQADTMPAEGEKNTNQATISQLFQRRAEKVNLNKTQPEKTTPSLIPPIITTTTQMQSPFPQRAPKDSSQTKGEHIKKDKGKKAMSLEDAEEESTESDFDNETTHVPGSTVESSKKKELKKFYFVTEGGEHVHLTKEQISAQKKIEEEAKAEAAKREGEIRKEELIDLLGLEVVNKYYNDKLQYDKYYDKMLNRRAASRITNCDILTRKGPITLKVYREDSTSEIIPNFKANDLHIVEWREDPLDKLNDLANKKRKHANDIHDYFKANKRLKSSVQYEDHLPGTVLNEPVLGMILFNSHPRQDFVTIEDFRDFPNTTLYTIQEIFFRLHQGPGPNDHARTFSSLFLVEIDKRNLNPLKQMRVTEQLRQ